MAFSEPVTGVGTSVAFGTTTAYSALQITDVQVNGISVANIPTPHLGLSVGDYIPYIPGDLKEGDTITYTFHVDMDVIPLPQHTKETITQTQPITDGTNTTAGTIAFSGYISNVQWGQPIDGKCEGSYDVKVAGNITFTDSSA